MKSILFLLLIFFQFNAWASECSTFETELEKIILRMKSKEAGKLVSEKRQLLSSESVVAYKKKYRDELKLETNANRNFMRQMDLDSKHSSDRIIYFDVENSVQKKMNDLVFAEKEMPDAVNTAFMKKFYEYVQSNPVLRTKVTHEYKDYKSLRLRLELGALDDRARFEKMLNDAYKKAVDDFSHEYSQLHLDVLTKTRTDDLAHPERWFLSGIGNDAIEANMAARHARSLKGEAGLTTSAVRYADHLDQMSKDVFEIEMMRSALSQNAKLLEGKVLEKLESGVVIPSKDLISILRKYKPSDFANDSLYFSTVRSKVKNIFKMDISEEEIIALTKYQQKVDALSPPLFQRSRTEIDLSQAENGLVSVDFTGVGVDNIQQQMKALAEVDYSLSDNAIILKNAFSKMKDNVDKVTKEMIEAKRYFSQTIAKIDGAKAKPQFSGDDGMYMPSVGNWDQNTKSALVAGLSRAPDPSKFRVTFVPTKYSDNTIIPTSMRSKLIVRAEKMEKELRDRIVGFDKMPSSEAKKIITAIDFTPSAKGGGQFKLIVSGKKLNAEEKQLISNAVKELINKREGEEFIGIQYIL